MQKRIDELTGELATVRAEAKDRRIKSKAFKDEAEALRATVATLTTERDTFKAQAQAQPGELKAEIDLYKGKLRDRDHKDKFRDLAKAAGVNESAIEDAYQLSGYKPEADAIDEAKITAVITQTLQGRDWLKAAPAQGANGQSGASGTQTGQGAGQATLPQGPGANRGGQAGNDDLDKALEARYPDAGRIA